MPETTVNELQLKALRNAIIEDLQIQRLNAQKVEICSMVVPKVILKDDKLETLWLDETNHPLLSKINEEIEFRINQIKQFYFPDLIDKLK